MVLGREPGHITGLGQDPPGDHRADPAQTGQGSAGLGNRAVI
jgi:hypothetical protein